MLHLSRPCSARSAFLTWLLAAVPAVTGLAQTNTYTDNTGDTATPGAPYPHLDITSVEVSVDDNTNVNFRVFIAGNPFTTDWGKYTVGLRSGLAGTTNGNGWGRPINMATGMTHWIASWVDTGGANTNGGGQVWRYSGGSWGQTNAPTVVKYTDGVLIIAPAADLGLSTGETFLFDVYSTAGGGGDGAVDAISETNGTTITQWNGTFTTTTPRSFTMPGSNAYTAWIAGYTNLVGPDTAEDADPDADGLSNVTEFNNDLGTSPDDPDSDNDTLLDGVELATGLYVSPSDTGSSPVNANTDNDNLNDADEVNAVAGFVRDPNFFNHPIITVPGEHQLPSNWDPSGATNSIASILDTNSLTDQFVWILDLHFTNALSFQHKFTSGSFDTNWGASGNPNVAILNGGNFTRTVNLAGIHRFSFNTRTLAHSFTRRTYATSNEFFAAYGVVGGTDDDGDGLDNFGEFTVNTDPAVADTDGDGTVDGSDPEPLEARRDVVFQVDMRTAIDLGYFDPNIHTVRVVGDFSGFVTTNGFIMSDDDSNGIYSVTTNLVGAAGTPFGNYKFYNFAGNPNGGFEYGFDRNFNLGPANVTQTNPVVFFDTGNQFREYMVSNGLRGSAGNFDQDPDGDGLDNGTEFILKGSPTSRSETPATLLPTISLDSIDMVIDFRRNSASASLNPRVQFSTNLTEWITVTNGVNGQTVQITPNFYESGVDRYRAQIPRSGQTRQYARMKADGAQ